MARTKVNRETPYHRQMMKAEHDILDFALESVNKSISRASKILGITDMHLRNRLAYVGIDVPNKTTNGKRRGRPPKSVKLLVEVQSRMNGAPNDVLVSFDGETNETPE